MRAIRRRKVLVMVMLVMILLSFFGTAKDRISGYAEQMISLELELRSMDQEGACDSASVNIPARIIAVKDTLDNVITREQKSLRVIAVRFLVVVFVLFYAIKIVYRAIIRRFGCRMIVLWKNIFYIHQIDGEKENSLLYTY